MTKKYLIGLVGVVLAIVGFSVVKNGSAVPAGQPTNSPTSEPLIETSIKPSPTSSAKVEPKAVDEITDEIKDFAFSPKVFKVTPGAKVTVINRDSARHTLTADDGKSFDTDLLNLGQSTTFTAPDTEGEFGFHCQPHPSMQGTLEVTK